MSALSVCIVSLLIGALLGEFWLSSYRAGRSRPPGNWRAWHCYAWLLLAWWIIVPVGLWITIRRPPSA